MGCHHCLLLKVRFIELDCKELIVAGQGKLLQSLHRTRCKECGTRGRGWMELCHPARDAFLGVLPGVCRVAGSEQSG